MIKIIKPGNQEQMMKRFKCPRCGCEWVASEDECQKIQSLEKKKDMANVLPLLRSPDRLDRFNITKGA